MRISAKIAPGVRVSGRVGGRRHHHGHGGGVTFAGRKGPWLRSIPPWRIRRITGLTGLLIAVFYLSLWLFELELWLLVWFYYGLFLGLRWCWRRNPIGQTIDSRAARRERRQRRPYDPHGTPQQHYDLGSRDQRE